MAVVDSGFRWSTLLVRSAMMISAIVFASATATTLAGRLASTPTSHFGPLAPLRTLPPLESGFGARPIQAAKWWVDVKPATSGTSALMAAAVIGQTPGRRRIDLQRVITECYGINHHKRTIGKLLKVMGFCFAPVFAMAETSHKPR